MDRLSWYGTVAGGLIAGAAIWFGCSSLRLPQASNDPHIPTGREVAADAESATREARSGDTGPALFESNFREARSDETTESRSDTRADTGLNPDAADAGVGRRDVADAESGREELGVDAGTADD